MDPSRDGIRLQFHLYKLSADKAPYDCVRHVRAPSVHNEAIQSIHPRRTLQALFGPWPPSKGASILLLYPQFICSNLDFPGSVVHPSGRRPSILFLVFLPILYCKISHLTVGSKTRYAHRQNILSDEYWQNITFVRSFSRCYTVPFTKPQKKADIRTRKYVM